MKGSGKLCDAADWFDPEFSRIVREELEEEPRFHRKQWEFARIFGALERRGFLAPTTRGLSMGGGAERLLYAVARRAGHLTVTDLYGADTEWACARTDHPDEYVKRRAPFPVDESRLTARRMDMRSLEFPDRSFDFCYSSCALEHIGHHDDFVRHLHEAHRVLRDDGVYVLTTEFHYGPDTLAHPHNYYFSATALSDLIALGGFTCGGEIDAAIVPHAVNYPLPDAVHDVWPQAPGDLAGDLLLSLPHVQLLVGRHPFTSICLVLRKAATGSPPRPLVLTGLPESRRFMEAGVDRWRRLVARSRLRLDPLAWQRDRVPPLPDGPRLAAAPGAARPATTGDTVFHSGYVWLGSGTRVVSADFDVWRGDEDGNPAVELRVHRHRTDDPTVIECVREARFRITGRSELHERFELPTDDGWCYAILAKMTSGTCWVDRVVLTVTPA